MNNSKEGKYIGSEYVNIKRIKVEAKDSDPGPIQRIFRVGNVLDFPGHGVPNMLYTGILH